MTSLAAVPLLGQLATDWGASTESETEEQMRVVGHDFNVPGNPFLLLATHARFEYNVHVVLATDWRVPFLDLEVR